MGKEAFKYFYKNYMIFLKSRDDSLIQIAGRNIFVFLHKRFARSKHNNAQAMEDEDDDEIPALKSSCDKFNLKDSTDSYLNNRR